MYLQMDRLEMNRKFPYASNFILIKGYLKNDLHTKQYRTMKMEGRTTGFGTRPASEYTRKNTSLKPSSSAVIFYAFAWCSILRTEFKLE